MTEVVPDWHRNPRRERFSVRLPDLGLALIALLEWFYEHPAPLHKHSLLQVLVLVEGGVRLGFEDGSHWELEPGEAVMFPPGFRHQPGPVDSERRALILDLRFDDQWDAMLQRWLQPGRAPHRWRCEPSTLAASIDRLDRVASRDARVDQARLMHAIWGLFIAADEAVEGAASVAPPRQEAPGIDKRLLYVESIMRRELEQPYNAEQLAHAIQLSVGQMNRLFKLHRGTTPLRRLQEMRLEQARRYLANSTLSVQQIAQRCGFVNAVHFAKLFKDTFGLPPRAYRASLPS